MPALSMCNSELDLDVHTLLMSLEHIRDRITGRDEDFEFLQQLFERENFKSLMKVHSKVVSCGSDELSPVSYDSSQTALDVVDELKSVSNNSDVKELLHILCNPHIQGLLVSHDKVAGKEYEPTLPDIPSDVDDGEESVKIIKLIKGKEPLGATIKADEVTGKIVIARVMHGGAADRSGLICVADEVCEVNEISVKGMGPDEVVQMLNGTTGTITFKLIPADLDNRGYRESKIRVKAHFDYDPSEDKLIPCKEAGLPFCKGEVLHIVSMDDPYWWQARKHGDRNMRAALIPGRHLQERREALKQAKLKATGRMLDEKPSCTSAIRAGFTASLNRSPKKTKKNRKVTYSAKENEVRLVPFSEYDAEEIVTYEEVAMMARPDGKFRPIVLIGAPGVGRNELKRMLLNHDPEHFRPTIPHTTRQKMLEEVDGQDFIFVSRTTMEADVEMNKFLEYGEYKSNLYGTSLSAIYSVVDAGAVCVLNLLPPALKLLRRTDLTPYVVFVKPPSLQRLKETRQMRPTSLSSSSQNSGSQCLSEGDESIHGLGRTFTVEELEEMIQMSEHVEMKYGHYMDTTLVNDDIIDAFNTLLSITDRVEREPQWVPAAWVQELP